MCGIIGIASNKSVSINIINALKKLEYRGYDSAGIATIFNGDINEKKCTGTLVENLIITELGGGIVHLRLKKIETVLALENNTIPIKIRHFFSKKHLIPPPSPTPYWVALIQTKQNLSKC